MQRDTCTLQINDPAFSKMDYFTVIHKTSPQLVPLPLSTFVVTLLGITVLLDLLV